ncbi:MAG: PD-(D/E)XK nuclease family protein [Candidatus Binatia bacterium]
MAKKRPLRTREPIEELILRQFEQNFQSLKFESGHALSPGVKEAARRQVLLCWKRLKEIAEKITDTEVRLNLPGQKTPKKRKFNIEGIVDIVRGKSHTVMYDLKTHDPDYIRENRSEYESQLNVYAHIWQSLRKQQLDEMAIIATQFPEALNRAWQNRGEFTAAFDEELKNWDPVIPIPFKSRHVRNTVREFGRVVDAIEDGKYSPTPLKTLKKREVGNRTFATRVCRNCDVRFSCRSYRNYVRTSKSRDLPRLREIYEDTGTGVDQQARLDAGLETALPGVRSR